ncbi:MULTISPECIES: hypothetical protein [unclassified Ensifer]|uniref:hypothetical protein n=1 Tax=unclassified Ensifer TaxID=2633371 RepID=UPI000812D2FE|nr:MULTISPECIES: hypothetical protein [unclassified Ensifer]OCP07491.1 hypothetical protein BBX50_21405 [Ensifer sp. LC11]OCP07598.1 hypothetical protein BC362_10665 [Ensifer sp. LC14]OCP08266.1 hypothetical protein BC374_21620 [Ensifer sp. LC13]OCP31987.1 hypothetical protein BC364_20875 [Ensifer sp. LC499]
MSSDTATLSEMAATRRTGRLWSSLPWMVLLYGLPTILLLVVRFRGATDYVGRDNDDVMRLVEVRDLLAGQSWFDLTQIRLGLEGGTLMHWSRLIDLPIAALISLFRPFAGAAQAEVLALAVWPIFLAVPLLAAMGLAGRRAGGTAAMHFCLVLTAVFISTSNRFLGGAIDHHNVQLVLAAVLTAMLVDRQFHASSYAIAGAAAALAIAVGAETTPFVAVVCAIVACQWVIVGQAAARATVAFGLSLASSLSVIFFATVPPRLYLAVTCDNLSIAFYALALAGGLLLSLAAALTSGRSRAVRFAALGGCGLGVVAVALAVAPQCLGNPLASLDPLLVELWLDHVIEARSFLALLGQEPANLGAYYFTGAFASAICIWRIWRRDRVGLSLVLFALVFSSLAIALVQVRGMAFSNLLAIVPISLLLSDLRVLSGGGTARAGASLLYVGALVISVPAVWAVAGALAETGIGELAATETELTNGEACLAKGALADLQGLAPSLVVGPSDAGATLLRRTRHRVLSAPYHRNAGGMLEELKIGLAQPEDAAAMLRRLGHPILAFCAADVQTQLIVARAPQGLYAALAAGRVPAFLSPLPVSQGSPIQLFTLKP